MLEQRLNGTRDGELKTGLDAFVNVARSRLKSLTAANDSNL